MSPPSISTWGSTSPFMFFYFNIAPNTTISCFSIMSIVFYNSTSILLTSTINVSPMSTWVYTCSLIFPFGVNATTSSTLTYTCCLITLVSKSSSFIAPPMPFADSIEACWLDALVLPLSFEFASTKNTNNTWFTTHKWVAQDNNMTTTSCK